MGGGEHFQNFIEKYMEEDRGEEQKIAVKNVKKSVFWVRVGLNADPRIRQFSSLQIGIWTQIPDPCLAITVKVKF